MIILSSITSYSRMGDEQDKRDSLVSNLSIFQRSIDSITVELIQNTVFNTKIPILVSLKGEDDIWFVEQSVTATLNRLGYKTYSDSVAVQGKALRLEVMPVFSLLYEDSFREGLFGQKKVHRCSKVTFMYQVLDHQNGAVLASGNLSRESRDFIPEDSIPMLENNSIKSTRAHAPEGSFFDRIIEPLIIVGATGTIIYLFFHVRS